MTPQEEGFLEKIDRHPYPLNGFSDLDQLHNTITVVLSDQEPTWERSYEISEKERKSRLEELEIKIKQLREQTQKLRDEKELSRIIAEINYLAGIHNSLQGARRLPNGNYRITKFTEILGEYVSKDKEVILYINVIRKSKSPYLLGEVYVHEMMHAYLDHCTVKEYFDKIEEPTAEYGMLEFFRNFDKKVLRDAKKHVRNKQKCHGTAHYGFGYCMFMRNNGVDFLDLYYKAKPTLVSSGLNANNYLEFWKWIDYPEDEFMCLVMLYLTLQSSTDIFTAFTKLLPTRTIPTSPSKNGNDYSKYAVNGYGPYAKTESALLAVCLYISNNPTKKALDVVDDWCVIPNLVNSRKHISLIDPIKRDRKLPLPNGESVYVSNQSSLDRINDIMNSILSTWKITIVKK